MGNDFELLENQREAFIEQAANVLESLDHARRLRKRMEASYARPQDHRRRDGGDFLFDLLRLNANYMNQLAKIGKEYNGIAHRALERMYSMMAPSASRPAGTDSTEIEFDRNCTSVHFVVSNTDPRGRVTLIPGPLEPRIVKDPWLTIGLCLLKGEQEFAAPFGVPTVLEASIRTGDFPVKRTYTSELIVRMGTLERRIPITINLR